MGLVKSQVRSFTTTKKNLQGANKVYIIMFSRAVFVGIVKLTFYTANKAKADATCIKTTTPSKYITADIG